MQVVHNWADILDLLEEGTGEVDALDPDAAEQAEKDLQAFDEFMEANDPSVGGKSRGRTKGPPRDPAGNPTPEQPGPPVESSLGTTSEGLKIGSGDQGFLKGQGVNLKDLPDPPRYVPPTLPKKTAGGPGELEPVGTPGGGIEMTEFTPKIKSEPDSLIGSDGGKLDNFAKQEQGATNRTQTNEIGGRKTMSEQAGEDFLGSSDADSDFEAPDVGGSDTDMMPVGTKRSWYNFQRYTKGKYRQFEGKFEIGADFEDDLSEYDTESELTDTEEPSFEDTVEPSRAEGVVDNRVIEPKDVDPDPVPEVPEYDINSPVPENNPLDDDFSDPDDPFAAEPGGPGYDVDVPPSREPFSWKKLGTWWRRKTTSPNDLSEPLLGDRPDQGTEMVNMSNADRSTYEMPLRQRPTPFEASPEFTPEMRAGLNDLIGKAKASGLSDAAIASEMGLGVSAGGGMWISRATLKQYMMKQAKGLMAAPIMVPLTLLLNQAVDGLGDAVSLGMVTADLLMTGDPLGLVIYGVGQMWDAQAQSRQKVIDNDTPDKDYGSKIGYVREGDTWYPAIYNRKYKSTGMWAGDQEITLDYGHEIVWRMDGEGNFVPMIPGSKSKDFVATDDEWKGKTTMGNTGVLLSSREFVNKDVFSQGDRESKKMFDSTRDWYFLSPEDTKKVMSGELQLESYTEDPTKMNSTARQINDWRKALDYSQDWKWSTAIQTMGPGATVNNYAGSRGLQRRMYEGVQYGNTGVMVSNTADYDQYIKDYVAGTGEDWDSGHGVHQTFKKYLMETVLKDHIAALYRTQKEAAAEAGFDKLYQTKVGAALEEHDPDRLRNTEGGTVWSAMYLDTAKDMPVAVSAEELNEQLHTIELLNDRTPAQRNYLAQKVQTRYWMQQIVNMGQSTDLLHMLNGRDWNSGDPYGMKKYTASATAEYDDYYRHFGRDDEATAIKYYDLGDSSVKTGVTADQHLDKVPGFAMPWQNAGEGWLPDLTGPLEGTSAKDYMDNYRAKAYDRLSASALANTTRWINMTGKLDPNLRLEGIDYLLREGGLWHGEGDEITFAWDEFAREYVKPGENTKKWTEFDPETGDYVLTEEGKRERQFQDGMDDFHKWEEEQKAARDKKTKELLDTLWGVNPGSEPPPDDAKTQETIDKIAKGEDVVDEDAGDKDLDPDVFGDGGWTPDYHDPHEQMQLHDYDVPEGWHWEQAFGVDADVWTGGFYVAPDGSRFGDSGMGPEGVDKDNWGMDYTDYVEILNEAQKRLDAEKAKEAEEAARAAKEAEALEAYHAMLDRKHAYGADAKKARGEAYLAKQWDLNEAKEARWARDAARRQAFLDSQKGIRTKGELDRQMAEFQKEDEIEAWRKRGVRLGVLDADFHPITAPSPPPSPKRPTETTSHVSDVATTHDEVEHVVGDHPMHSFSAGSLGVLSMWAGHSSTPNAGAVKVI